MISRYSLGLTFLASAIVFSYGYCLDLFQALEVHFREPPYDFTTSQFNLMYFFTYLPIFLFNIPIGTIIDRSPVKVSLFVLICMSFFSQLVCTLMVQTQITGYIVVMYIMRCFFGVAGEGIFTVQGLIITKFCKDNFEVVMSVALSLPFIFDSLNSLVTTRVYDATNSMIYPWYIGIIVCIFSLIAGLLLYKLYLIPRKHHHQSLLESSMQLRQDDNQIKSSDKEEQKEQEQTFSFAQLRSLSSTFWVLIAASFFTQMSLASFTDNLNDLLVKRFNIPYTDAGTLLIIPYSCLTIFSIIFSLIMSKWPKTRRVTYIVSTFLYFVGQISLYLLPQTQNPTAKYYIVVAFFCLSMSFSFSIYYTGILAAIPYVVPQKAVGTAFGVVGCVVGLSQCTTPFMNIAIIDSDPDLSVSYKSLNLVFILLAFIPLCFAVYIKCGPFSEVDSKFEDNQQNQDKQISIDASNK